ncbi:MAG: hypothetical protein M1324_02460 [Patescibacteria group bacterium]|nr:hypothetical protein [Patescibacteria group bacterium]
MTWTKRPVPELAQKLTRCSHLDCRLNRDIEKDQIIIRSATKDPYHEVCYDIAKPDLVKTITVRNDERCEVCTRTIPAGTEARQVIKTGAHRHASCHLNGLPDRRPTILPSANQDVGGVRGHYCHPTGGARATKRWTMSS